MSCVDPKFAFRRAYPNANGKYPMVFSPSFRGDVTDRVPLPCGKCIGCRADRAHEWAIRIYQEASLYDRNSFLTLTYDDVHLPKDGKISKKTLQDFWKRLRHFGKLRYFACGEYGEKTRRPHYHAIVFGQDFRLPDTVKVNDQLYATPIVSKTWGLGNVLIADFSMSAACYVSGYVQKKVGDTDTFNMMSRMPGIGSRWLANYHGDISRLESVVIEGKECPVPRRYMLWALDEFEHIQKNKQARAREVLNRRIDKFGLIGSEREAIRELRARETYLSQQQSFKGSKEKI